MFQTSLGELRGNDASKRSIRLGKETDHYLYLENLLRSIIQKLSSILFRLKLNSGKVNTVRKPLLTEVVNVST